MHCKRESQIQDTVLATNIPGGPKITLSLSESTRSINRGENNNNNDTKNNNNNLLFGRRKAQSAKLKSIKGKCIKCF